MELLFKRKSVRAYLKKKRVLTQRFDEKFVVFKDRYSHCGKEAFENMYRERHAQMFGKSEVVKGARNVGQMMYQRKFDSDFAHEMNRSVQTMLHAWEKD